MKRVLRKKLIWGLVLLIGVILYPFETTIVTPQSVLVVTESWNPIQGVLLRQSWKHYSLEADGHEEDKLSDENGRASFSRRAIRASLLPRAFGPIAGFARQ